MPLCPELKLHIGLPLFRRMILLPNVDVPPPFWAFAWGAGQALARHLLDHPEVPRDQAVLDLGAGSGIVAIAAAKCGASRVTAAEVDPYGRAAIGLNAELNQTDIQVTDADLINHPRQWDLVLASDVFYVQNQVEPLSYWFDRLAADGGTILVADPGRPHFPLDHCEPLSSYDVQMYPSLENYETATVYCWRAPRTDG